MGNERLDNVAQAHKKHFSTCHIIKTNRMRTFVCLCERSINFVFVFLTLKTQLVEMYGKLSEEETTFK